MIREFAFGLGRRHYFEESSNIVNWMELHSDTYMSLYEYDNAMGILGIMFGEEHDYHSTISMKRVRVQKKLKSIQAVQAQNGNHMLIENNKNQRQENVEMPDR